MSSDSEPPFKVLALDGGGIKGVFGAALLAGLEEGTGKSAADHFDLIVGTSTGGIIALGLGLGHSAVNVLEFYRQWGPEIFPVTPGANPLKLGLKGLLAPKYSPEPLRNALQSVFGSKRLGESKTRLVVVSYDGQAGDIHLLKTAHHKRFTRDYRRPVVDVALATSAAPVFFPASQVDGRCEVDGGIWANCPALVGAVEALRVVQPRPSSIKILSIGTTSEPFYVKHQWRSAGFLRWNLGLIEMMSQAQIRGALAQAALLVGKENFLRVDHIVEQGRFTMDDSSSIEELAQLGRYAARQHEPAIREQFLGQRTPPFEPYHRLAEA